MFSTALTFTSLLLLFSSSVHGTITIDQASCAVQHNVVSQAVNDAIQMAGEAVTQLSKLPDSARIRDAKDGFLFKALFDPQATNARPRVIEVFSNIARFNDPTFDTGITIFCNEDAQDPKRCQGKTLAYTKNSDSQESQAPTAIVLCDQLLQRSQGGSNQIDIRPVNEIKSSGLKQGLTSLDQIKPMSRTLLHEFTHARPGGGMHVVDGKNQARIRDKATPTGPSIYGYKLCFDNRDNAINIADCYTQLGLGLFLQFQSKTSLFTWTLGRVGDNYLPQQPPKSKRRAESRRDRDRNLDNSYSSW